MSCKWPDGQRTFPMRSALFKNFRQFGIDRFEMMDRLPAPLSEDHLLAIRLYNQAVAAHQALELRGTLLLINDFFQCELSRFEREETLMSRVCYPDTTAHKREHAGFIEDIQHLLALVTGQEADVGDVLGYINCWLIGHVFVDDRNFADFLRDARPPAVVPLPVHPEHTRTPLLRTR